MLLYDLKYNFKKVQKKNGSMKEFLDICENICVTEINNLDTRVLRYKTVTSRILNLLDIDANQLNKLKKIYEQDQHLLDSYKECLEWIREKKNLLFYQLVTDYTDHDCPSAIVVADVAPTNCLFFSLFKKIPLALKVT